MEALPRLTVCIERCDAADVSTLGLLCSISSLLSLFIFTKVTAKSSCVLLSGLLLIGLLVRSLIGSFFAILFCTHGICCSFAHSSSLICSLRLQVRDSAFSFGYTDFPWLSKSELNSYSLRQLPHYI